MGRATARPSGRLTLRCDALSGLPFRTLFARRSGCKGVKYLSLPVIWSGFNHTSIEYDRSVRHIGKSKWTFSKRSKLIIDSIASFSYQPIRLMSVSGVLISTTGFLYALVIIVNALIDKTFPEGWPTRMIIILVLSGFQLLMLGIVAEYWWQIFSEGQRRPPFIIIGSIRIFRFILENWNGAVVFIPSPRNLETLQPSAHQGTHPTNQPSRRSQRNISGHSRDAGWTSAHGIHSSGFSGVTSSRTRIRRTSPRNMICVPSRTSPWIAHS